MSADPFADDDGFPAGATKTKPIPLKQPQSKISAPFPVTWLQDAELNLSTRALLKGLIDPGAFVVIYGPSGSGKSFFTADIAQHIATGQPWRGRRVSQGLVVYVASEAGSSILKRFVGWRENRLGDAQGRIPLAILTRGPNLLNSVDVAKLEEQLVALQQEAELPLSLVVFDTLSRSIPGGDENNAEDMTQAVNAADYLREKFNAATVYVHHTGKDPSKGARGHSALFAAADLVLGIIDHAATVEKIRDGVSGEKFPFVLEPIEIGTDPDGDPVMTCLLNTSDIVVPGVRPEPTGKNQRIVLKELRAITPDGRPSPGTSQIPKGVLLVTFDDLAEKACSRFAGLDRAKARGRISEALSSLLASGYVGIQGELIWLA